MVGMVGRRNSCQIATTASSPRMIASTPCRKSQISFRSGCAEPRLRANFWEGIDEARELYLHYRDQEVHGDAWEPPVHANCSSLRKTGFMQPKMDEFDMLFWARGARARNKCEQISSATAKRVI